MALTKYKDLDDYLEDWRNKDVIPYWRRYPWRDDYWYRRDWQDVVWDWPLTNKDGFQVTLDVQHYKPYEITVRTSESMVHIEAKHEERLGGRTHVIRQFNRSYSLPYGYNPYRIAAELSSDGYLTVRVPYWGHPVPRVSKWPERIIR